MSVEATPLDFRMEKEIGNALEEEHVQLKCCGGIDHNYCLDQSDAAQLHGNKTGITMTVSTTMPGIQVYSGNFLAKRNGKHGTVYHKQDAICLETQYYPNAMACDGFEKPILKPGEAYHHTTEFAFSIR